MALHLCMVLQDHLTSAKTKLGNVDGVRYAEISGIDEDPRREHRILVVGFEQEPACYAETLQSLELQHNLETAQQGRENIVDKTDKKPVRYYAQA